VAVATNERLGDVLDRLAAELLDACDADACAISRVLGDLLLLVANRGAPGKPVELDRSFLVSEFPETQRVLLDGMPRAVHVGQSGGDAAEQELLATLGYQALLMLPLALAGASWGLVEVYREDARPFGQREARAAFELVSALSRGRSRAAAGS
jgi:hypothetical protein